MVQREPSLSNSNVNSNRRPDAIIRIIIQHYYGESCGYGEVKTKERINGKYDLVRDLVRCVVFGKEAIDLHKMNGKIDERVSFYVESLFSEGIYVFAKICHIVLPMSICDLSVFITQFDGLLQVIKIYNKTRIINESPIDNKLKRPTLNSPTFLSYVDKRRSKFDYCRHPPSRSPSKTLQVRPLYTKNYPIHNS